MDTQYPQTQCVAYYDICFNLDAWIIDTKAHLYNHMAMG